MLLDSLAPQRRFGCGYRDSDSPSEGPVLASKPVKAAPSFERNSHNELSLCANLSPRCALSVVRRAFGRKVGCFRMARRGPDPRAS